MIEKAGEIQLTKKKMNILKQIILKKRNPKKVNPLKTADEDFEEGKKTDYSQWRFRDYEWNKGKRERKVISFLLPSHQKL